MKRAPAIAAGIIVGVLLAGAISPALIATLPPRLRGASVVWTTTAVVVASAAWGFWALAGRHRD